MSSRDGLAFAARLQTHLERAGINQKQLAQDVGVHPNTVGKWIQGVGGPKYEHLLRILAEAEAHVVQFGRAKSQ